MGLNANWDSEGPVARAIGQTSMSDDSGYACYMLRGTEKRC